MKLEFGKDWVAHRGGRLDVPYPVLDARCIGDLLVVLYDYMAFAGDSPARNLFAYGLDGALRWRAEDIGMGRVDGYTHVITEEPLVVGNFAGYSCVVELETGRVRIKEFTK